MKPGDMVKYTFAPGWSYTGMILNIDLVPRKFDAYNTSIYSLQLLELDGTVKWHHIVQNDDVEVISETR